MAEHVSSYMPSTPKKCYVVQKRLNFINIPYSAKVCFSRSYISSIPRNKQQKQQQQHQPEQKKIQMDLQFKQLLRLEYTLCFVSSSCQCVQRSAGIKSFPTLYGMCTK